MFSKGPFCITYRQNRNDLILSFSNHMNVRTSLSDINFKKEKNPWGYEIAKQEITHELNYVKYGFNRDFCAIPWISLLLWPLLFLWVYYWYASPSTITPTISFPPLSVFFFFKWLSLFCAYPFAASYEVTLG